MWVEGKYVGLPESAHVCFLSVCVCWGVGEFVVLFQCVFFSLSCAERNSFQNILCCVCVFPFFLFLK